MTRHLLPLCALLVSLGGPAPAPKIQWQESYEQSLELAAEQGRVVFVVVDHEDEGRCEDFQRRLLRDKRLLALAERTLNVPASIESHKSSGACPRFAGLECSDHRRNEAALRDTVLAKNQLGTAPTPQYIWLNGKGEVLLSVPFEVEPEGMIWCFETAQRMVDPASGPPSAEARPPRRLLMRRTLQLPQTDRFGRGMTEDELKSALAENKKSLAGLSNRALIGRVLFTDEPAAVEYVEVELSGVMLLFARDSVPQTLRLLGLISPARFWKVLEDYAKHDDPGLRLEAAVALEQLGAEDALRLAKAGLKREKQERLLGAWARALGACGASDKGTRKALLDLSEEGETPELRASATFALGHLQRHEDIRARWAALLESGTPELAAAAACGAALARDEELVPALDAALAQAEGDQKAHLELAAAVLAGGDLYPLGPVVAEVTGDDTPRERIFFAGPASAAPR